ncbi:SGNH/GDSL hydrolase family protein [Clostridium sp.]|uniref:SGNH/GDSL hydrolase family protein n=1 Tax=Clostridium sp. TaxID=1506 RepID=UPI001A5AF6FD|nr:SGNH/GDSL hydrolase family protein [Clostridium sp.]MBK5243064.1 SGNH/GDSL hydrolase family protein [Clostridium sp.]
MVLTYWSNKTWNVMGDSITDIYNPLATKRYFDYIKDYLGFSTIRNYGISGSCIGMSEQVSNPNPMSIRYTTMDSAADLITVLGGVNDFGRGVQLGTMSDRTINTFFGACHVLFSGLIEKYPDKIIAIFSPLQTDGFFSNPNIYGLTEDVYVNAMEQVANYYALPFLNLFKSCGINSLSSVQKTLYQPDGLHLNNAGHERVAKKMAIFINSL